MSNMESFIVGAKELAIFTAELVRQGITFSSEVNTNDDKEESYIVKFGGGF